jgi:heme iron utilization protein
MVCGWTTRLRNMDSDSEKILVRLLKTTRIAALGTSHEGAPFVSMISVARPDDGSAFYVHVSRLAQHTRDMDADPRVSLMLAEPDDGRADPQTLARLSIQCRAEKIARTDESYAAIQKLYLSQFPASEQLFSFGDFGLWKLTPEKARFVAGFARAFNVSLSELKRIATGDR